MLPWVIGAALAGERDPLPALPVERPLAVPRGWTLLALETSRAPGASEDRALLRYGLLPRVEVNVGAGIVVREGEVEDGVTGFGARLQLVRHDVTNSSVAVDLGWSEVGAVGIAGARRFGPLLGTVDASVRSDRSARAGATALLQVGPLAPWASVGWDGDAVGTAGLVVQLSRGFAVGGAVTADRSTVGVEIAW